MMRRRRGSERAGQGGAALFLSLLLLMLLTVTGVSAVQESRLESRMARNAHDGLLALQAAEAALASGERLLGRLGPAGVTADGGVGGILPGRVYGDAARWLQAATWAGGARVVDLDLPVAEPPRFVIEPVAVRADGVPVFRVTARGVGGSRDAVILLQSTYALHAGGGARLSWREVTP